MLSVAQKFMLLRRKKAGYSPISTNLELYLNYKVSSSLTLGVGGISQWNDLSGTGRHLTQATGSSQPALNSDGVLFDGVNDVLAGNCISTINGFSFFIVSRTFATGGTRSVFSNGIAANGFSYRLTTTRNLVFNAIGANTFGNFPTGAYEIVCANWNRNTGTLSLYVNGILTQTYTGLTTINEATGANLTLGNRDTAIEFINASVKGVLLYSRSLTTDEITNNFNFLNSEFLIY